jgi:hypothetical protein
MCSSLGTLVALSAMAWSQVPNVLSYQGRLTAPDNQGVSGSHRITFSLFNAKAGGSVLWSEGQLLGLTDGYYSTTLGAVTSFPADLFDGKDRWLEIAVDGATFVPRQQVGSVPYAQTALNLAGGTARASKLTVNGAPAIDGAGVVGLNAGAFDTLVGTGTAFLRQAASGDVVVVKTDPAQARLVVKVQDDSALVVNEPFPAAFTNAAYSLQKPLARLSDKAGGAGLFVNGSGHVAVGALPPAGASNALFTLAGIDTIDGTQGQGLMNLVAGATVNSAGSGYVYLGTRGASRIMLHDGAVKIMAGDAKGTAGGAVTWGPSLDLDNTGAVAINSSSDSPLRLYKTSGTSWNYISFGGTSGERLWYAGVDPSGNFVVGADKAGRSFYVQNATKSFVQDHPEDPTRQIAYVSLEGGEAGTYWRGTARLTRGRARIALPKHFALVTNERGLTAQVTPRSDCEGWVSVAQVTPRTLELVERGAADDCQVDYLVQGLRRGYEGFQPVQPKPLASK